MTTPTPSVLDRWSWVFYPLVAVLIGGFLGSVAGRTPATDPFTALSPRDPAWLVDVVWIGVTFAAIVATSGFMLGLRANSPQLTRRLANGLGCAAAAVLLAIVYVIGPVALCLALVLLSVWAGLGAGPLRGALLGAGSVTLAIGLGTLCLCSLGRPLGRLMVNKKREAMENAEEDTR